jgi:uncharacterized protein YkwD
LLKWLRRLVIVFICVLVALAAVGCNEVAAPSNTSSPQEGNGRSPSPFEQEIFDLVNQARVGEGLEPLKWAGEAGTLALEHSMYMEGVGSISHDGFQDRADELLRQLDASRVGENVAMGYPSGEAFVDAWLASEGHRENILNPLFKRTGIGCFEGYATQIFCD